MNLDSPPPKPGIPLRRLLHPQNLIVFDIPQILTNPLGHRISRSRTDASRPNPKCTRLSPEIKIAGRSRHRCHPRSLCGRDLNRGSDSVAIALVPDELQSQPVVARVGLGCAGCAPGRRLQSPRHRSGHHYRPTAIPGWPIFHEWAETSTNPCPVFRAKSIGFR
jgi:hypothetical protein